jgi:hypothetical protein
MSLAERMTDCLKERQGLTDQIHCRREAVREDRCHPLVKQDIGLAQAVAEATVNSQRGS